jgi:hypothetical protein
VVPRSANKISQDDEFSLYGITLFKKDIPEFSHRCRENKFAPAARSDVDGYRGNTSTATLNSVEKPKNTIKPLKRKRNYG